MMKKWMIILPLLWLAACTKSNEPTVSFGKPVPPPVGPAHTLAQLIDSLPGCTIYKAAWAKAGMPAWVDSARQGNAQPFTLFVPTDSAFAAAGLTANVVSSWSVPQLDSLILYLLIQGSYPAQNLSTLTGNIELYPPLVTNYLQRSLPDPGFLHDTRYPYQYELYLGWLNNTLQLNGHPATHPGFQSLAATDGTIWLLDTLVQMPQPESYQILSTDTVFSYYMAACRYSNQFYKNHGTIGTFNDTLFMQLYTPGNGGKNAFTIIAPVNDAFRRAGFNSVSDITAYIDQSVGATPSGKSACTNMDSILRLTTIGIGPWNSGAYFNTFFTSDLLNVSSINSLVTHQGSTGDPGNPYVFIPINFTNDNGRALIHRNDYPNGRAAHVIAPYDLYTLNGVIHAMDNLLLPTP